MNQYKKLFGNTVAIMIGNFSSKILVFVMLPFYTACLSTDEYGIVDLVYTTTNLLYPLLTLVASEFVLRFALENKYDKTQILSSAIKLHFCGFAIMILCFPLMRFIPHLYEYRITFYLYYFFITLSNIVLQFIKGCGFVKVYSFGGFLNTLLTVVLNILFLLKLKMGINGYLLSYIIASIVTVAYVLIYSKSYRYIKLFIKTDIVLLKSMLNYSVPMIPNSVCWWVNNSLDRYTLLMFTGSSALGIYAAANKIPSILTVLSTIFINAWQLSSVDAFGTEENRKFFSNVYKKYSSLIIFMTAVMIMFTRFITMILLNKNYADAGNFSQILLVAFLFHTMAGFLGTIYTAAKKTNIIFISTLCGALVNLIFNFMLVPQFGCIGASFATAVSYFAVWLMRLWNSQSIIKLSINTKKDIFCYVLIFAECIITVLNVQYSYAYSAVCIIIIFVLNYREYKDILSVNLMKSIFSRK